MAETSSAARWAARKCFKSPSQCRPWLVRKQFVIADDLAGRILASAQLGGSLYHAGLWASSIYHRLRLSDILPRNGSVYGMSIQQERSERYRTIFSMNLDWIWPRRPAAFRTLRIVLTVVWPKSQDRSERCGHIGSRPSDHYFPSVCWFVCLSVCLSVCLFVCLFVCTEFSQPSLIRFRSN